MKSLVVAALLLITVNSFAVDQNLIDGACEYDEAVITLQVIEQNRSDGFKRLFRDYDPNKEEAKYQKALALIKKFEPIKKEYDKQVAEEKRKRDIQDSLVGFVQILGLPIAFFTGLFFMFRLMIKRNKRLLKEGKITPEAFRNMMLSSKSSLFSEDRINPATGFPISGGGTIDAGGNVSGSSSDRYYRYDRYW